MRSNAARIALVTLAVSAALFGASAAADPKEILPAAIKIHPPRGETHRRANDPDWFERVSGVDPSADGDQLIAQGMLLRLQEDRIDGTDLLTLRYSLDSSGTVRTFVGAGLGRSVYYAEDLRSTEVPLSLRGKHTMLGAAAEVGTEWAVSEQVRLDLSARWADLASEARVLRTDHGPVVAQPLVLVISLGYRFR
jgi:hypothetical protein